MDENDRTSAGSPGPEPGAPAGASSAKPEAPAGVPSAVRDPNGRFKPGKSGNEKGRPKGIPNLNTELVRAVKRFKIGDKSWLQALLTRALQDPQLAKVVLDKIAVDATPVVPTVAINNRNSNHQTSSEAHVRIGDHLEDPRVRGLLAEITQRLGDRGAFAGGNGHDR